MNPFDQPIQVHILRSPLAEIALAPQLDYIFDASELTIDAAFVSAYAIFLEQIATAQHARVLVVQNEFLALFPESLVVVPTLGEAEDLIEMERIERDLGF